MKKTLVAIAIAAVSTSAFADVSNRSENAKPMFEFDSMHKEQFSVSGAAGIGGYYDTKTDAMYDDWATALTVSVSYENNRLRGYLEVDLEMNYTTDNNETDAAGYDIESGPTSDVDKAWVGFETGAGIVSYGWENDTALDKVDGAGDFTYEFGSSAADASDAHNVFKFQGSTSGFAYGISSFDTDDSHKKADTGANGYLGFEHEMFNVYAGYETRNKKNGYDYDVVSVSGNVTLGQFSIGLNTWVNDNEEKANEDKGFYTSAAYALDDQLTLAAGYKSNTTESDNAGTADVDTAYFNVAAMYTMNDRVDMGIDIRRDTDVKAGNDEETYVFAAAFYSF
ncbi:porin [Vibrio sp. 03-59-1]|uniref:porin n=1 Tax=Vibrio sp. 03-59-1 TaxID=2607607 RepID=UPI001493C149|nr:porin [Vibrio sp. 03-59-1]NOH84158.1 porin [Vibrio sp. 03-59-1]